MFFAEFNGSSPIKNITGRLNLGELPLSHISANFTVECAKKHRPIR